jgi:hypothetical protein
VRIAAHKARKGTGKARMGGDLGNGGAVSSVGGGINCWRIHWRGIQIEKVVVLPRRTITWRGRVHIHIGLKGIRSFTGIVCKELRCLGVVRRAGGAVPDLARWYRVV